jgi:hypothetical protein
MLRITVTTRPDATAVAVEGRLAGPWVDELADCWRSLALQRPHPPIRIELDAVTFIDASGKALLRSIYQQGAVLEASGCMTRATVDEIKGSAALPG